MAKSAKDPGANKPAKKPSALRTRNNAAAARAMEEHTHIYAYGAVCDTDAMGHETPGGRSITELVVDSDEGFVPLWDKDVTLRWRFQERSMQIFVDPEAAKQYIRELFGKGVEEWGDAPPVKFSERHDAWDFEIVMQANKNCNANGCVLASAFFPDAGRHEIKIYPSMFEQSRQEQIETMAHEIGHVFGLRHFFAKIRESWRKSEIFGTHAPFSIMNYGPDSFMTQTDRDDLKALYSAAWDGSLADINGTPIKLVRPFSDYRSKTDGLDLIAAALARRA